MVREKAPPPDLGGKGSPSYQPSPPSPHLPPRPPPLVPPFLSSRARGSRGGGGCSFLPSPTPPPPPLRSHLPPGTGPVTCSSKRLTTAWTHSTGLCAAMSSPRPGGGGGTARPAPRAGKRAGSGGRGEGRGEERV